MKRVVGGLALAVVLMATSSCTIVNEEVAAQDSEPIVACGVARSAEACGGWGPLIAAARKEGSVVIAGDPDETPHLVSVAAAFARSYGIKVTWVMQDADTTEQLERSAPGDQLSAQPDLFTLEPSAAIPPADRVSPYRFIDFDMLPDEHKDPDGLWVRDFAGVMSVGYNATELGPVQSLEELARKTDVKLSLPGDPGESVSAAYSLLMLDAVDGSRDIGTDGGLTFLRRLEASGNLAPAFTDLARLRKGTQNVAVDWSYVQYGYAKELSKAGVSWQYLVPPGAETAAYHGFAINKIAPHPAAARLWEEFLFTAPIQVLITESGAMPTLYHYLQSIGVVSWGSTSSMPNFTLPPWEPKRSDVEAVQARAAADGKRLFPKA